MASKRRWNWPVVVVGLLVAAFLWFVFPKYFWLVSPYKSTPAFVEPLQMFGPVLLIFCPWWPIIRRSDPPAKEWMHDLSALAVVIYLVLMGVISILLLSCAGDFWCLLLPFVGHLVVTFAVLRRPRLLLPLCLSSVIAVPLMLYGGAMFVKPGAPGDMATGMFIMFVFPSVGIISGPLVGLAFAWLWRWRAIVRQRAGEQPAQP